MPGSGLLKTRKPVQRLRALNGLLEEPRPSFRTNMAVKIEFVTAVTLLERAGYQGTPDGSQAGFLKSFR